MLFKVKEASYEFMPLGSASLKDVAINNFYWLTQECIVNWGPVGTLVLLSVMLVIMTALKTGATYASLYYVIPMRAGIVRDIRNFVYDKIVSLPIAYFTSERKGDVMARMTGDVAEIENSIMSSLDMLFKNPVMIIVCLSGMIMISWQLTIFVLVLLPIAGTVMGRVGKRLKRKSLQGQQQWGYNHELYRGNPRRSAHHQGFQCRRQGKAAFPRRQPAIFQHHRISAAPPVTRPPNERAARHNHRGHCPQLRRHADSLGQDKPDRT